MLRPCTARIAAVVVFDIDEETVVRRLSGRRMCRAAEHVYHLDFKPPAVDGVCDIDGSELYQRDDDQPDVIVRTRFQKQWVEAATPVIDYYRGHAAWSSTSTRLRPADQVAAAVDALLDSWGTS